MKKISVLVVAMMLLATLLAAQGNKVISQQIYGYGGYWNNQDDYNVVHPNLSEEPLEFRAFLLSRPGYVMYGPDEDLALRVEMNNAGTRCLLRFNLGNFTSPLINSYQDWEEDEIIRIEVSQPETGYVAYAEFPIGAGSDPQSRHNEYVMVLKDPPPVLFDSYVDDIVTDASFAEGYDPSEDGVYRVEDWGDDNYVHVEFATLADDENYGYDNIEITTLARRQYEGDGAGDARGPEKFVSQFSFDGGDNWYAYGNPEQEEGNYHLLPNNDEWIFVRFSLPQAVSWRENVMLRWVNISEDLNENGWLELKDFYVKAEEIDEAPFDLLPPNNLAYDLEGYDVHLSWGEPAPYEYLMYDRNEVEGAYTWPGYTMGTRMTPAQPAQILSLYYYTATDEGDKSFDANVWGWASQRPSTEQFHNQRVTAVDGWTIVDISTDNVYVEGDFVVGFGSLNETTALAYDNFNNNRSWDYDPDDHDWYAHDEAYMIRALVLYDDNTLGYLAPVVHQSQRSTRSDRNRLTNNYRIAKSSVELNALNIESPEEFNQELNYRDELEVIGYNVYRDGDRINEERLTERVFVDEDLPPDNVYRYHITAIYTYEQETGPSLNILDVHIVSVEDDHELPSLITELNTNYPNPFNPNTTISFSIANDDDVKLQIFNSRGQRVATLVDNHLKAGNYSIVWEGRDDRNREVSSGIYFYRMEKGSWTSTQKMLLVK